jgi:hypothetical protein
MLMAIRSLPDRELRLASWLTAAMIHNPFL